MIQRELDQDVFELRTDALQILLVASYLTCGLLAVLVADINADRPPEMIINRLIPLGVVCGLLFVSHLVKRTRQIEAASWILVLALLAGPTLDLVLHGPSQIDYLFYVPAVMAANVLVRSKQAQWITVVVILIMAADAVVSVGPSAGVFLMLAPAVICGLISGLSYLNERNILRIVYNALDVQQKDSLRAEMFYRQEEELRLAVLEVHHAQSKLERLNVEVQEARDRSERISQAKSVFLANMSHEIRTPLSVVIGYTSAMLNMPAVYNNTPLPGVYQNDIHQIKENGEYLVGLVNDILDLSKIEAGRLEIHCEPVNLFSIFHSVIQTSNGLIKEKKVRLCMDTPADLPKVWADPVRVRQVLLNLLSNAIKFTPAGTVTLRACHNKGFVDIAVIDTGIGIPEHALDHIFDRFQQAEHDTDKHYGGTGLGLDISKELVRMHGGNLTVQSQVGQGSTFSFGLPVISEEQANVPAAASAWNNGIFVFTSGQHPEQMMRKTILLSVGENDLRLALHRVLEDAGHVVVDAQDTRELLNMVYGLQPDFIILGNQEASPGDGETLNALKSVPDCATIPIVILTPNGIPAHAGMAANELYLNLSSLPQELLTCVNT